MKRKLLSFILLLLALVILIGGLWLIRSQYASGPNVAATALHQLDLTRTP